jgi:Fe-S cluster biogenesis protein NfuA/rhodanese-related sulfurtransferase
MLARETIAPDWTLGRLKESFPGVELALFAFFGVGSRERSGFSASETLADLLRRHLVFDAERACARLDQLAAEDCRFGVAAGELAQRLGSTRLIDARAADEHRLCRLAGSELLSAETVASLRASPPEQLVVVCGDGSQAPAASRHLRGMGLPAYHLHGGLAAWSEDVDESFPIIYPLWERPGRWHLLADGRTLRLRRDRSLRQGCWRLWDRPAMERVAELRPLLEALPRLQLVAVSPHSFAARLEPGDLHGSIARLAPWSDSQLWWSGGEEPAVEAELAVLQRVLAEEAGSLLKSHKGTVEIAGYRDRALLLKLGGGCAGCASAQITTQKELAAALYREVPLLDRIGQAD